ncbi:MAG: leucine-rich repeat domain-containing protein [Lachnospiraceae bacterium]
MNYAFMSEDALLKTIVEEELDNYEARYGKAECPRAKPVFIIKLLRLAFLLLLVVVGLVCIFKYGLKILAAPTNMILFIVVIYIVKAFDGANLDFSMEKLIGSMNPVVHYVMVLAKKNPDKKIRDIIHIVCENPDARRDTEYRDNGQYAYGTAATLNGMATEGQERMMKVAVIFAGAVLLFGLVGVMGYYMIPRVSYVDEDEGYMVQSYNQGFSLDGKAVIPAEYNGKPVVSINEGAFKGDPFLKSVELPDTILRIGGEAFKNCKRLENINIPNGVLELRGNTFEGCTSLSYVEVPDSVVEIHGECFLNCKGLQLIKLSANITEIKGNTFEGCSSLQSIDIPYGVTRIAGHAFYGCNSLSTVNVPSTVTSIGSSAFRHCNSLYGIALPQGVEVNERAFKESPTSISYYTSK